MQKCDVFRFFICRNVTHFLQKCDVLAIPNEANLQKCDVFSDFIIHHKCRIKSKINDSSKSHKKCNYNKLSFHNLLNYKHFSSYIPFLAILWLFLSWAQKIPLEETLRGFFFFRVRIVSAISWRRALIFPCQKDKTRLFL